MIQISKKVNFFDEISQIVDSSTISLAFTSLKDNFNTLHAYMLSQLYPKEDLILPFRFKLLTFIQVLAFSQVNLNNQIAF